MRGFGEVGHLVRRFVVSLSNRPPSLQDEAWAQGWLSPGERALWQAQPARDRRHCIGVARRVARVARATDVGQGPSDQHRWLVPAALLHDVGKAGVRLGVFGRSVATGLEIVGLRRAPGRLGRYLGYPSAGAALLAAAGSDERVVSWAREHHLAPALWSVPRSGGEVLAQADRDA